jgi:hypothetical protein
MPRSSSHWLGQRGILRNAGAKSFKVHLDGYDQRDLLAGRGPDKRRELRPI